jgi:hypothetical protein
MWEFEKRHGALPTPDQVEEVQGMAKDIWSRLKINPRGVKEMDPAIVQ